MTMDTTVDLREVGPCTAAGEMLRRYWMPACLSEDVAAWPADPTFVPLLGERFVAFRSREGQVGVLPEACPHRGASLMLARVEECGLRCIYHGWQLDVEGRLLDAPNVPQSAAFLARFKPRGYPVVEQGGIVWVYLDREHEPPPLPDFPFLDLDEGDRMHFRMDLDCNYLQVLEGALDPYHTEQLHHDEVNWSVLNAVDPSMPVQEEAWDVVRPSNVTPIKLEVELTDYGFQLGIIRRLLQPDGSPGNADFVKTLPYMAPFYVFTPGVGEIEYFVPYDDHHTGYMKVCYRTPEYSLPSRERFISVFGFDQPLYDERGHLNISLENHYGQDRAAMRRGESYVGLKGFLPQDGAVTVSMGTVNHDAETLVGADVAITTVRRMLHQSVESVCAGGPPLGLHAPRIPRVGTKQVIAAGQPWQSVVDATLSRERATAPSCGR